MDVLTTMTRSFDWRKYVDEDKAQFIELATGEIAFSPDAYPPEKYLHVCTELLYARRSAIEDSEIEDVAAITARPGCTEAASATADVDVGI